MAKRVCVVTSTRADWGLLQPLALLLRNDADVELSIVATNMHLMPRFGHTVDEIEAAGFTVDAKVHMDVVGDDGESRVRAMACCLDGMAKTFTRLRPDVVIILGDRYEMLGVASAAAVMSIPIVHIAGGEISEGAVDDSIRHAITKLSSLHLTATEEYRNRVIQLGEDPEMVVNTGAIGVYNAMNVEPIGIDDLEKSLCIRLKGHRVAVVTYHPATNDIGATPAERVKALLLALDRFPDLQLVITYPNNDAGGESLIPLLEHYAEENSGRVCLIPSLGMSRYLSMLRVACMVVGNSSSGIVEVPSCGIPTVDIGIRQRGRMAAESVIHCGDSVEEISAAIAKAGTSEFRQIAAQCHNPYFKPDTPAIMLAAIKGFLGKLPLSPKKFRDIRL